MNKAYLGMGLVGLLGIYGCGNATTAEVPKQYFKGNVDWVSMPTCQETSSEELQRTGHFMMKISDSRIYVTVRKGCNLYNPPPEFKIVPGDVVGFYADKPLDGNRNIFDIRDLALIEKNLPVPDISSITEKVQK